MKSFISITLMVVLIVAIASAVGITNSVAAKTVTSEGYTLDAPTGWKVKGQENRFSGFQNTLSYSHGGKTGSIVIEHSDVFAGVDADRMETVLKMAYDDASVFESGDDKYVVNNMSAPYVIATFTKTNLFGFERDFVVMAVAVQLTDEDAVNVQYIADKNDFDKLLPQVEKIIQSVKPTETTSNLNTDEDQKKLTGYGGSLT
jgi:hypothetical protein